MGIIKRTKPYVIFTALFLTALHSSSLLCNAITPHKRREPRSSRIEKLVKYINDNGTYSEADKTRTVVAEEGLTLILDYKNIGKYGRVIGGSLGRIVSHPDLIIRETDGTELYDAHADGLNRILRSCDYYASRKLYYNTCTGTPNPFTYLYAYIDSNLIVRRAIDSLDL